MEDIELVTAVGFKGSCFYLPGLHGNMGQRGKWIHAEGLICGHQLVKSDLTVGPVDA